MGNSSGIIKLPKYRLLKKELITYIFVGILAVLADFIFYKIFVFLGVENSIAKRVSFIFGAFISFFLNKKITFNSKSKSFTQPILFALIYLISFIINSITHDIIIKYFQINIAFASATCLSIVINYLGQKYIVFKKK